MNDLDRRVDALPAPLRDGTWTQCLVQLRGRKVVLSELPEQLRQRRQQGLRRRATLAASGGACLLLALLAPREAVQVAAALLGAFFGLAALDGLRRDLRRGARPMAYAVIDPGRNEVTLLHPGGPRLSLPLRDLSMFLLVVDPVEQRFHLGVVMLDSMFLPWLHTHSPEAASSMVWLLGHLTDRPARQIVSELPAEPMDFSQAEALSRPGG